MQGPPCPAGLLQVQLTFWTLDEPLSSPATNQTCFPMISKLPGDVQRVIFVQLRNPLDPGVAVAFGSASSELWALTQAPRQQLQADHEAAAVWWMSIPGPGDHLGPRTRLRS